MINGKLLIFQGLARFSIASSICHCLLFFTLSVPAQMRTYELSGRIVDDAGRPIRAGIFFGPLYNNWKAFDLNIDVSATDESGKFRLFETAETGSTYYLFASAGNKHGLRPLTFPFAGLSKLDSTFLGTPVKLGTQKKIDLGAVPVRFWFEDIVLEIRKKGELLKRSDWEELWCRVKNDKGKVLAGSSLGPIRENEIDISQSVLRMSLPEGKWRIEFQQFDYGTNKIFPKVLGRTPYFTIRRRQPLTLKIDLQK